MSLSLGDQLNFRPVGSLGGLVASVITVAIDLLKKGGPPQPIKLEVAQLNEYFLHNFDQQVFQQNQQFAIDFGDYKFEAVIIGVERAEVNSDVGTINNSGLVVKTVTQINFVKKVGSTTPISFIGGSGGGGGGGSNLFKSGFDFEQMGIGGLGTEFQTIFRRAFASRLYPTSLVKEMGFSHVKGILLYGPPGCGKTLIARKIGQALNARPPKIVNGPEVLDKYVGGSEEKIRELFADAEKEMLEMGDDSMLHIIIFDELDAIMKQRGSTRDNTGVNDSIVNQLLSKIDGVDSLNNILIIGMTNRIDMIDEAILRPGRLEVHVEIGLPDAEGRKQILGIHTSEMKKHNRLTPAAIDHLPVIVEQTKNFTGAELAGLVRSAASFALAKNIDAKEMKADWKTITVDYSDFDRAVQEVVPQFGQKNNEEISNLCRNGLIAYGPSFDGLMHKLNQLLNQSRNSERTPLMSVLLEGPRGTGKTAIAAKLAISSEFPLVRLISPDAMIGMQDYQKCQLLLKIFNDAYRSPLSFIFIDDIERIIEYTPIGHRFSNQVLQTLLILLRKVPPTPGRRIFIIATTSISHLLEDLQLTEAFNVLLPVQPLTTEELQLVLADEFSSEDVSTIALSITKPIGIKQLLMVLEMAKSDNATVTAERMIDCLQTCGF
eukprot:CAMPEP_0174821090 /NCGR_PEP_ID=MMETSP1107-20130205/5376_1 /TAXON_ID=36770 /ORGANISM="Paraphysomonas vestita, Strain GFlagA" /LENGTH=659 /DNA_ID=CAMNT_0016037761 /DNA_START=370 /DNA_END=2349 /DNA_ORIENTATION=-